MLKSRFQAAKNWLFHPLSLSALPVHRYTARLQPLRFCLQAPPESSAVFY